MKGIMTYDDLVRKNILLDKSIPEALNGEHSEDKVIHTASTKEDVAVEAIIEKKTVKVVAIEGRKQLLKKEKTAVLNIPSPGTLSEIRNT